MDRKRELWDNWIQRIAKSSFVSPALTHDFALTVEAEELLSKYQRQVGTKLYMLYFLSDQNILPAYVGISRNPLERWKNGHCQMLMSYHDNYINWINLFHHFGITSTGLMCIAETDIPFPPFPNLPCSIEKTLEQQLINLVSFSFPETCLNKIGVAR